VPIRKGGFDHVSANIAKPAYEEGRGRKGDVLVLLANLASIFAERREGHIEE